MSRVPNRSRSGPKGEIRDLPSEEMDRWAGDHMAQVKLHVARARASYLEAERDLLKGPAQALGIDEETLLVEAIGDRDDLMRQIDGLAEHGVVNVGDLVALAIPGGELVKPGANVGHATIAVIAVAILRRITTPIPTEGYERPDYKFSGNHASNHQKKVTSRGGKRDECDRCGGVKLVEQCCCEECYEDVPEWLRTRATNAGQVGSKSDIDKARKAIERWIRENALQRREAFDA